MSALDEAIFERLYPRYERTFGEAPPLHEASVEEAVAEMRSRLRAHASEAARSLGPFQPAGMPRRRQGGAQATH